MVIFSASCCFPKISPNSWAERYIPCTLLRFKNAYSVFFSSSNFGFKSVSREEGAKIQSGFKEDTISISGLMASPTFFTFLYLDGILETLLFGTPTRSRSSLSQISATAGDVATILGLPDNALTFAFAFNTACFSFGSVISSIVSTLSP